VRALGSAVAAPSWADPRQARPSEPGQAGRKRTVALPRTDFGLVANLGKEIHFLFFRIVKSISKLSKFVSNSFLVQKL
jgi:hypothetical protein